VPPTAFHARTGLLTPPGIFLIARGKILPETDIFLVKFLLTPKKKLIKKIERVKNFFSIFLLQRNLKRSMTNSSKTHAKNFSP
jgi:hypothetical protein